MVMCYVRRTIGKFDRTKKACAIFSKQFSNLVFDQRVSPLSRSLLFSGSRVEKDKARTEKHTWLLREKKRKERKKKYRLNRQID